jgi:hypothetical protein
MESNFQYHLHAHWPKLTWVAELADCDSLIHVQCGNGVEQRTDWFCEAVWDGEFEAGDFDQTDIVAGSGARRRDQGVTFVSAGSILDRLHYIELDDRVLVSNSLSALMVESGASIDITYAHYQRDFGTICAGLDRIKGTIRTSKGDINLVYFENLTWDGKQIQIVPKPRPIRDFFDFDKYQEFMQSAMHAVVTNSADPGRTFELDPLVSVSNGYDSPAVAVLASRAGVANAFTIGTDRDGKDDSGIRIGEALGYSVEVFDRNAWKQMEFAEVDCIAGSGAYGEVTFQGMQERLDGCLLLSGFWGGIIWNRSNSYVDPDFSGLDGCGLCFTEMRLERGFIHCPVPYWGGLQTADLARISQSNEMLPWSIGGRYDRPVSRRIVEEAGIPRDWFGMQKHGSSDKLLTMDNFLLKKSLADYERWIRRNASAWMRKGRIPPYPTLGHCFDRFLVVGVIWPIRRVVIPVFRRLAILSGFDFMRDFVNWLRNTVEHLQQSALFFRRYTFPWALERSCQKYRKLSDSN